MWRQYRGGRRWTLTAQGPIEVEGEGTPTSSGSPRTMVTLFEQHGPLILQACERFNVPVPWLAGMIPVEAARLASNRFAMDPVSLRYEPGYKDPVSTPRKVSAGLTQCLLATAQQMADLYKLTTTFEGEPRRLSVGDLMIPRQSLYYGAAYMRYHIDRFRPNRFKDLIASDMDFVLMTSAYNAGSIRYDKNHDNPFHLLTFSPTRTSRAIMWHNDCYRPEVYALWSNATPPR